MITWKNRKKEGGVALPGREERKRGRRGGEGDSFFLSSGRRETEKEKKGAEHKGLFCAAVSWSKGTWGREEGKKRRGERLADFPSSLPSPPPFRHNADRGKGREGGGGEERIGTWSSPHSYLTSPKYASPMPPGENTGKEEGSLSKTDQCCGVGRRREGREEELARRAGISFLLEFPSFARGRENGGENEKKEKRGKESSAVKKLLPTKREPS